MILRGLASLSVRQKRWLIAAAALVVVAGVGLLVYQPRPLDANAYLTEAEADIGQGNLPAAAIALRNAAYVVPFSPGIRLRLATVYMKLERFPLAEVWAQLAKESGADEDRVDPLLAQAMLQQSKLTALIKLVPTGTRDPKAEADIRVSLGLAHLYLGDIDLGTQLLADAKRLDPATPRLPLGLARLALIKGDVAGAETELRAALALDPQSPEVLRLDSDVLRAKGDIDGALAVLGTVLGKHPNDLATLVARADIFTAKGDLDDAQKDVNHALELAPQSLTPNLLNALLVARRGDFVRADELVTAMSEYFTSLPAGYYLEGVVKYALGQYPIAEDSLSRYLGRRPGDPAALRILAAIALHDKDYAHAIQLLQPVADADPGDRATLGLLVQAYLGAGRKDAVVALYEKAAATQPDDPKRLTDAALMRVRFGDASVGLTELEKIARTETGLATAGPLVVLHDLRDGDVAKAATTAEALAQHDGSDLVVQNLLGGVRLAQFRFAEAEKIFTSIIAKDPDFLSARHNLARVYLATGRVEDARQVYEDVLQRQPKDVPALISLADLDEAANQLDNAVSFLRRAMAAAPDDIDPGYRLAQLYARHKQWVPALAAAADLVKRFPRDPHVVDLVASVRAASGDTTGAVNAFFPFTQWYPNSANVLQRYAEYQAKAGDKDGARKSLEKARVLEPDNTQVMTDLVDLDFADKGGAAALVTARSFAPAEPVAAALLSASVLVRTGSRDDAIAVLTQAQAQHPAEDIALRLAELTYGAGKHDEAEDMLQAWIAQHQDAVPPRLALANLYMLDRAYDRARPLYEQVLKQVPTNIIAMNNLAWIYARDHDPRANDLAQRAFHLAPNGTTADTLGWTLLSGGDAKSGLPFLKTAVAALPQDMSVQYHLAVALAETGETAQARSVLERVVASNEAFDGKDDAKRALDKLDRP